MCDCPYFSSDSGGQRNLYALSCPGLVPERPNSRPQSQLWSLWWSTGVGILRRDFANVFATLTGAASSIIVAVRCVGLSSQFGESLLARDVPVEKPGMTKASPNNDRSSGRSAESQPLLTLDQVQAFFQSSACHYGLFLSLDEASQLSGNTPGTLRKHASEGWYDNSVVRGRPLRFVRDQFCVDVANRPRNEAAAIRSIDDSSRKSTSNKKAGA